MRLDGRFGRFGGCLSCPKSWCRRSSSSRRPSSMPQEDPAFQAELGELLANYAGRPTPLTRCRNLGARQRAHLSEARGSAARRRAQDQPGARPGPARARRMGKTPADRRDRRRPARRRDRDRRRAVRARDAHLHGRRGRRAAAAQRLPDAADGRRGGAGGERRAHAQGRDQRGAARLDGELRRHPLSARHGRRAASLPADGPRISAGDRHARRGRRSWRRRGGCPTRSSPASAAAPTRSACSPTSSPTRECG